ncbi:MAG: SPOR domain-containing protein [Oceanospirillaceae bacterium]|nr:SPOR domain-containing protein [Oceanospirillaceae bacterium]
MASRKDFAQKKNRSSGASRSRSSAPSKPAKAAPAPRRAPRALLLVTLVAVGGLGFGLYRLIGLQSAVTPEVRTQAASPAPKPAPAPAATAKTAPAPAADAETQRRFEFYDMLPKSEVEAPQVEAYKSTPRTAKLEHSYLLQAGSFRDPADAERMRARLLLAGLPNVTTSRVDGSNGTWYRVRSGPFTNRQELNKAENKMVKLSIQPMQIKQ